MKAAADCDIEYEEKRSSSGSDSEPNQEVEDDDDEIEEFKQDKKSLMPEGFEALISKQEMADLLAFLNNRGQFTPLTLTTAATNRIDSKAVDEEISLREKD